MHIYFIMVKNFALPYTKRASQLDNGVYDIYVH